MNLLKGLRCAVAVYLSEMLKVVFYITKALCCCVPRCPEVPEQCLEVVTYSQLRGELFSHV